MYTIIGADGREYGPVPAATIQQWIAARRADANTRIRAEGAADWTTLGQLPEFAEALRLPPPPLPTATPFPVAPATAFSADPGASPLPPDVAERDYELDFGGCIGRAWTLLTGPLMWTVIGGVAVFIAIQFGLAMLAQIPFLGLLFSLANFIVSAALTGGLYAFLLRCVRGQPADVGHLFDGFRYRFGQLFVGNFIVGLITVATMLPGLAMAGGGVFLLARHISTPGGVALCIVGGLLALVPAIYCGVSWAMTLPLIIDKRLDFWPAMQLSRRVVGKHWWLLFGFMIVTGLISCSGAFLCLVGLFFTIPLGTAALCYAYETLFGPRAPTPAATATPVQPIAPLSSN